MNFATPPHRRSSGDEDGASMPVMHSVYRQRLDGSDGVLTELPDYEGTGGYVALKKALTTLDPDEVLYQFHRSGLRGRGGAGFPMGRKAGFLPKSSPLPAYVVCNADESEPGTFKDREIMEENPFQLLEGIVLAAYAVGSHRAYIYIRGEYEHQARVLDQRIAQARAAGYLGAGVCGSYFDCDITVYRGAGAYICGEETGLLESLEGKRGQPRLKPPFPAVAGLYGSPTLINNVETLAALPPIIDKGADWYAAIGPEKSPGIEDLLRLRPRASPRQLRGRARRDHSAGAGVRPGRRPCGPARRSRPAGSADRACPCSARNTSTRRSTTNRCRPQARSSAPAGAS